MTQEDHEPKFDTDALMQHLAGEMQAAKPYPIPTEEEGFAPGAEFAPAPDLEALANKLMERYDELLFLAKVPIIYRWKKTGGDVDGGPAIGHVRRTTGELKHETGAVYYVWLAADNCRDLGMTYHQIEAALYHQLKYPEINDKGKYVLRAPDFKGFFDEYRRYGPWQTSLKILNTTMRQMNFFDS